MSVNGQPGLLLIAADGSVSDVLSIDVDVDVDVDVAGDAIQAVRIVRNPDKLRRLTTTARPATCER